MPDVMPSSAAQVAAELKTLIAAEREGESFLRVRASDGSQRIIKLPKDSRRATIGRHCECDISLS